VFLLIGGVNPVLVCSFLFHAYIVVYYGVNVKQGYPITLLQTRNATSISMPEGRGLTWRFR
jgi:hypothetical protein